MKAFFFFNNEHLLDEINRNFITLIPNVDKLETPNHYRPISLCNVCYKILANILPNRVKPILNKIVLPLQGVFVLGRLINDNILMHSLKKKKRQVWVHDN